MQVETAPSFDAGKDNVLLQVMKIFWSDGERCFESIMWDTACSRIFVRMEHAERLIFHGQSPRLSCASSANSIGHAARFTSSSSSSARRNTVYCSFRVDTTLPSRHHHHHYRYAHLQSISSITPPQFSFAQISCLI